MSTPRKPKRFEPTFDYLLGRDTDLTNGIRDQKIKLKVAHVITIWPHVERRMIAVFRHLAMIDDEDSASIMWWSIINHRARIDMMRKLLEKSPRHKNKDASYDVLLDSYNSLAVSRNTLAHALWYSKEVTNTTYIEERPDGILSEMREFSEDEIDGILSGLIRLESMFAVFLEKAYSIPNKGAVIT